ncbi:MAG: hypothetical protein EA423_07465 [Phycisphaerales bacterium]|nr:MAG: hypothetical protein EA423_07465 [Phycisphaerales bacterium]
MILHMTRAARHSVILELVGSGIVSNQEQLQEMLAERGLLVTQPTLSRDLRTLGVFKGPMGYRLPEHAPKAFSDRPMLRSVLKGFVTRIECAGNLVILRTGPGHAQIVGLELDRTPLDGVFGTLAGDDTIFIAMRDQSSAMCLRDRLRVLSEMAWPDGSPPSETENGDEDIHELRQEEHEA